MAYRDVRVKEAGNKLAFRFDPERDRVQVYIRGQLFEVALDDYRPLHRRQGGCIIGVDFEHIEGEEVSG
jgi:hypothetical protein